MIFIVLYESQIPSNNCSPHIDVVRLSSPSHLVDGGLFNFPPQYVPSFDASSKIVLLHVTFSSPSVVKILWIPFSGMSPVSQPSWFPSLYFFFSWFLVCFSLTCGQKTCPVLYKHLLIFLVMMFVIESQLFLIVQRMIVQHGSQIPLNIFGISSWWCYHCNLIV